MKIAVLGCSALGMLIGSYLSKNNEVYLVDIDKARINEINSKGVVIFENDGSSYKAFPSATTKAVEVGKADLVIFFVKPFCYESAIKNNKNLIDKNTYVMTLQDISDYDNVFAKYISEDKIILGNTAHISSIIKGKDRNHISHDGSGQSHINLPFGDNKNLEDIIHNFNKCDIETYLYNK